MTPSAVASIEEGVVILSTGGDPTITAVALSEDKRYLLLLSKRSHIVLRLYPIFPVD